MSFLLSDVPPRHNNIDSKQQEANQAFRFDPITASYYIPPSTMLSSSSSGDGNDGSMPTPVVACDQAGMDSTTFATYFSPDGRTQTTCAAGDRCGMKLNNVMESAHHCMGCALRMHSPLFCGDRFDSWYEDLGNSFVPTMLPPHGQAKFNDYADRLGETGLFICHSCIDTVAEKMSSPPTGSTIIFEGGNNVSASSLKGGGSSDEDSDCSNDVEVLATTAKKKGKKGKAKEPKKPKKKVDWSSFISSDWEKIEVSVGDSNVLQNTSPEMTRLRGIRVNGELVPTVDITLTDLKILGAKNRFNIKGCRGMDKKTLCNMLIKFRGDKEKPAAAGVTAAEDSPDANAPFNDYRFLNVMFSDAFSTRFGSRAKSLTKHDFDQVMAADQQLYTDFLCAHNNADDATYGKHAHPKVSQAVDPMEFQPIPPSQWKRAEERFKFLYSKYEKSLLIWTESGTNCDYDELKNLSPPEEGNKHLYVYMHYFVRDHKQLLQLCTASLPKNAFRDSTSKRRTPLSPLKRGKKRNGAGAAVSRSEKENATSTAASNQYRNDAMISIADKNESIAEKERESKVNVVVDRVSSVGAEMRAVDASKKSKMKEFVEHCGRDKKLAKERIANMKMKREQPPAENADGSDSDDSEPESQETIINEIIDQEKAYSDLNDLYNSSMRKAKEYSTGGSNGDSSSA